MKRNYQKELEQLVNKNKYELLPVSERPTLLLHSCCAPCSSYCMEYLRRFFQITILYYNPNITNQAEYQHRVEEQKRLIKEYNKIETAIIYINQKGNEISPVSLEQEKEKYEQELEAGHIHTKEVELSNISFLEGRFDPKEFLEIAKGYEEIPEGGERCFRCYRLRLTEAAVIGEKEGFDYFSTTLTISPLKNAEKLNSIGEELAKDYKIQFLPSDFKKNNGYKRSTDLSKKYHLYRQDYCGCGFSKAERERQKQEQFETK